MMFNFIAKYFYKDVDAVLGFLTTAVKRLEALAEAKAKETVDHVETATGYTALAQAAAAEQAKARIAIKKLQDLFR